MSTSKNRQLSYTALKEIVPLLPFTTRYNLRKRSKWIRPLCEELIKVMKFCQPYGEYSPKFRPNSDNSNIFGPQYSARLTVDSATWHFDYDEELEQVRVTCSLYPGKQRRSKDKSLAKWFFTFFIRFKVVQLELEESADPFEYFQQIRPLRFVPLTEDPFEYRRRGRLRCSRLRWKLNRVFLLDWMAAYASHNFDVVELVDIGRSPQAVSAAMSAFHSTQHVIWRDEDWHCGGRSAFVRAIGISYSTDRRVQHVRIKVHRTHAFGSFFQYMKGKYWATGSSVELSYEKEIDVKERVWTFLESKVRRFRIVALPDREISVLKVTDDFVIYAELFEEDVLRFKMSKVARENCQLDLEALRD